MTDRVAVVTGAARGIGLATSKILVGGGTSVVMVDRDADALELATKEIDGNILPLTLDVSVASEVDQIFEQIEKNYARLDCLINNAGVADFGPIEETSFERWRTVMETNLDGVFLCTQAATPLLKESAGCIVNIASISGLRASTLRVAYGTSKAAVIQLTRQQAVELGEYGIRSNAVAPGPVRTKLAMAVHTKEIIDAYHDAIPLNRYGSEEEIANLIVFLCSKEASYITGQIIAADGGFECTGVGVPALRK